MNIVTVPYRPPPGLSSGIHAGVDKPVRLDKAMSNTKSSNAFFYYRKTYLCSG